MYGWSVALMNDIRNLMILKKTSRLTLVANNSYMTYITSCSYSHCLDLTESMS